MGGDTTALRSHDRASQFSWRQYGDAVRDIACGLLELSVDKGETIGLMLSNRPEFHLVDAAALHVGATPFSIYNTMSPQQIAEVCANAENRIIVTESRFLPVLRQAGVTFEVIVCVDDPIRGTLPLEKLVEMTAKAHISTRSGAMSALTTSRRSVTPPVRPVHRRAWSCRMPTSWPNW
ncbi:AMP-binding protein [Nocardia salmonicida]